MPTFRYLIPIKTLKELEPWLRQNIGYEHCLLHNEFEAILDATLTTLKLDDDEKQLYLEHDTKLTWEQHAAIGFNETTGTINQEERYEYAINIGANIVISCEYNNNETDREKYNNPDLSYLTSEDIESLLRETCIKAKKYNNDANTNFSISDIYYLLILFTVLYHKCKNSSFYHLSLLNSVPISEQEDIFKLYQFLHTGRPEPFTKKVPKVSIVCNNQQLQLNNEHNWFISILNEYLVKRMKLNRFNNEAQLRHVNNAYKEFKQTYPKVPGYPNDVIFNTLLISLYKLTLIFPGIEFPHKSITYKQVDFIIQYLKYLGFSIASDIEGRKNLRSKINYLIKHDKRPCWLDFSTYRQISDDEVFIY